MHTMLRAVLRNVQYYLLFFSIILVLLAFQRLQFLDRGWIVPRGEDAAPSSFISPPPSSSSSDAVADVAIGRTTTTLMRGGGGGKAVHRDDSTTRSIDIFKFRLGLFEFALPSWSSSSSSSSMTMSSGSSRSIATFSRPTKMTTTTTTTTTSGGRRDGMVRKKKFKRGDDVDGSLLRHPEHSLVVDGSDKSPSGGERMKGEDDDDQRATPMKTNDGSSGGEEGSVVVAYVVIVPFETLVSSDDGPSSSSSSSSSPSGEFRQRRHRASAARALSRSVEKAHASSKYDYRLYALNFANSSTTTTSTSTTIRDLSEAGFEVVDVNELHPLEQDDDGAIIADDEYRRAIAEEDRNHDVMGEGKGGALRILLDGHEIVVHIGGTNSIVVGPMDDLFDALTGVVGSGVRASVVAGIVDDDNDVEGGGSTEEIDSFTLESTTSSVASANDDDAGEFYVFKSTSRRAFASYLTRLECLMSSRVRRLRWANPSSSREEDGTGDDVEDQIMPSSSASSSSIRKDRHRLERGISEGGRRDEVAGGGSTSKIADCSTVRADNSGTRLLDRCLYDAGSLVVVPDGGDYRDCSDVGTREDIRLARFQGMSSTDVAEADVAESGRNDTERGDNPGSGRCGSPWVYPSEEGCSSDHDGRVDGGVCTYLCKKWFLLGL